MSAAWIPEPSDGAELLTDVETFLSRFVVYPSEAARIAHVLWIGHTWFMDQWDSTPRIAFLSPEPGSGKSRALEVMEPLVPRAVHAVNTSPAYLFRKVSDEAGPPTILYDEIDTVFGPKAKDNEDVRGMLNAGHRKGAMAGRCVIRGRKVETEELPAYCAVALAGLDDLPDTIMTRSVIVRMRRRAPHETVEPWRLRLNGPEAEQLGDHLREWANTNQHEVTVTWPDMPEGIEDRNADVWESLLAVADLAGGEWPDRARLAAVELVRSSVDRSGSLGVQLLSDLHQVFNGAEKLATETILDALHIMEESPWGDLRGKPLDSRGLSRRLVKYGVKPKVIRIGETTVRGYDAADLTDPWSRYLAVTSVTDVTHSSGRARADVTPQTEASWKQPPPPQEDKKEAERPSPENDVTDVTAKQPPNFHDLLDAANDAVNPSAPSLADDAGASVTAQQKRSGYFARCEACEEFLDQAARLTNATTCTTCEIKELAR